MVGVSKRIATIVAVTVTYALSPSTHFPDVEKSVQGLEICTV
jgi:hypothetical protein